MTATTQAKHTPEPWRTHGKMVVGGNPEFLIADCSNDRPETREEDQANARRIVACVNACSGIPNEELEKLRTNGALKVLADNLELTAQRDELAAALRDARASLIKAGHDESISGAVMRIDIALAKPSQS